MADQPPKKRRGRPPKVREGKADDVKPPDIEGMAQAAAESEPLKPPPSGDVPPGEQAGQPKRRRSRVTKKGTQQIEDALRELLQMPAVPAALLGDEWAAAHFTTQGGALANKIAVVSERNPVLRRWCERMMEGESIAVLLMAGIMYAGPPLLHFGVFPGGELIGVPVIRKPTVQQAPPTGPPPMYGREAPEPERAGQGPAPVYEGGENGEPPTWRTQMMG